jgi:hypothetical protein
MEALIGLAHNAAEWGIFIRMDSLAEVEKTSKNAKAYNANPTTSERISVALVASTTVGRDMIESACAALNIAPESKLCSVSSAKATLTA